MPIYHHNTLCRGVAAGAPCRWSTRAQFVAQRVTSCPGICAVCSTLCGRKPKKEELCLQLRGLYLLDADVFQEVRELFPRDAALDLQLLRSLVPRSPPSGRPRAAKKICVLVKALDALCSPLTLSELRVTVCKDTLAAIHVDWATRERLHCRFLRALVTSYLESDGTLIFGRLCAIKSAAFHVYDHPMYCRRRRKMDGGSSNSSSESSTASTSEPVYGLERAYKNLRRKQHEHLIQLGRALERQRAWREAMLEHDRALQCERMAAMAQRMAAIVAGNAKRPRAHPLSSLGRAEKLGG